MRTYNFTWITNSCNECSNVFMCMCCGGFIMHVHEPNEIELKMDEQSELIKNAYENGHIGSLIELLEVTMN